MGGKEGSECVRHNNIMLLLAVALTIVPYCIIEHFWNKLEFYFNDTNRELYSSDMNNRMYMYICM